MMAARQDLGDLLAEIRPVLESTRVPVEQLVPEGSVHIRGAVVRPIVAALVLGVPAAWILFESFRSALPGLRQGGLNLIVDAQSLDFQHRFGLVTGALLMAAALRAVHALFARPYLVMTPQGLAMHFWGPAKGAATVRLLVGMLAPFHRLETTALAWSDSVTVDSSAFGGVFEKLVLETESREVRVGRIFGTSSSRIRWEILERFREFAKSDPERKTRANLASDGPIQAISCLAVASVLMGIASLSFILIVCLAGLLGHRSSNAIRGADLIRALENGYENLALAIIVSIGASFAVLLGHRARKAIREADRGLGGQWYANWGVILGYLNLLLAAIIISSFFSWFVRDGACAEVVAASNSMTNPRSHRQLVMLPIQQSAKANDHSRSGRATGRDGRSILPDFGATAGAWLIGTILFPWVVGVASPLGMTRGLAMEILFGVSVGFGLSAVFGILALLGFGRRQGRLNKGLGAFSLLLGGFMCFMEPGVLNVANDMNAAKAFEKGEILVKAEKFSEAIEAYSTVLRVRPKHPRAHLARARALVAIERPKAALEDSEKALAINPSLQGVSAVRAVALEQLERHDEALREADKALAAEPMRISVLVARAESLLGVKRTEEASAVLRRAIEAGGSARAYYVRGLIATQRNDIRGARADFDTAIALDPGQVDYLNARGELLRESGDLPRGQERL